MADCDMTVVGIQVHYCDEDGKPQHLWVDLDKVHALSWCLDEVGAKRKGETGTDKLPRGMPRPCPKDLVDGDPGLCWWNGSKWVCGEI